MFCWFYRLSISHSYDVEKPVTGITKKHLKKCENCRHFYNVTNYLENNLPIEAKLIRNKFSLETDEQIIQNIGEVEQNPVHVKMNFKPIAAAAGIIFISLVSLLFLPSKQESQDRDQFNKTIADFSDIMNFDRGVAFTGIIEEPIQAELNNIVGDVKSVAKFLLTCVDININSTGEIEEPGEANLNTQK